MTKIAASDELNKQMIIIKMIKKRFKFHNVRTLKRPLWMLCSKRLLQKCGNEKEIKVQKDRQPMVL